MKKLMFYLDALIFAGLMFGTIVGISGSFEDLIFGQFEGSPYWLLGFIPLVFFLKYLWSDIKRRSKTEGYRATPREET